MPAKSLNLDVEVCAWIESAARKEKKSQSELANEVFRVYLHLDQGERHGRK